MSDRRYPSPSHNFVPEYQQSGIPFVKTVALPDMDNAGSAVVKIEFDSVTRWLMFHMDGHADKLPVRIYFSEESANNFSSSNNNEFDEASGPFFEIHTGEMTPRLELKCKAVWLAVTGNNNDPINVSVIAGLTNINALDFPDQTSDNGFTGV